MSRKTQQMRASRSCNDPELFQKVKDAVTMQQTVEYYGLKVSNKGLCLCPFHRDTHPSMKIYPNGKGFYCFVCGAGGDPVKFTALFRGISNLEAAKELASVFHVPVSEPVSYREKREMELARRRRTEIAAFAKHSKMYLIVYYGLLCEAIRAQNSHFFEGLQNISWAQYMMEQISECPEKVFDDQKAVKKIGEIEGRINNWYFEPGADGAVPGRDILSDLRD